VASALAVPCLAHDDDQIAVRVTVVGPAIKERMTMTAGTLELLVPQAARTGPEIVASAVWDLAPVSAGQGPCRRSSEALATQATKVELSASFDCPPGDQHQAFRFLSLLPKDYSVLVTGAADADKVQLADAALPEVFLSAAAIATTPENPPAGPLAWATLGLGVVGAALFTARRCFRGRGAPLSVGWESSTAGSPPRGKPRSSQPAG